VDHNSTEIVKILDHF